jgi:hypothetical protein
MSSALVSGTPAYFKPLREGVATIGIGAVFVNVPDAAITANSMVMVMGITNDATANLFAVDNIAVGAGFDIRTNAAATAATNVRWWVLRY